MSRGRAWFVQVAIGSLWDHLYRGIEQWVARVAHNHKVGGSSPSPATSIACGVIIRDLESLNEVRRRY